MPTCVPWELDSACCNGWADLDPSLRERAETLAWDAVRTLTAGRVGACPVVMRPCLSAPCSVCSFPPRPFIRDGDWHNTICGRHPCSCERMHEIVFPGEVAAVIDVMIDDTSLLPVAYRLINGHRLMRVDGEPWPSCQDMNLAVGEPGTVGITYIPGIVPDDAGLWAAGVLACEFSKACSGAACRLPTSVTSIVREGVAYQLGTSMFPGGMTGIREVDAYILSVNPNRLSMPPMVWSPDVPWAKHRYESVTAPVVP